MRELGDTGNMRVALAHRRASIVQTMLKLYSFIGATVGSYAGWALGAPVGTMTAFMLSFVGTGLGIYAGRRVARYYGA